MCWIDLSAFTCVFYFCVHFWNTLSMTESILFKTGLRKTSRFEKNVSARSIRCGERVPHKNRLGAHKIRLTEHSTICLKTDKTIMNFGCGCYQRAKSLLLNLPTFSHKMYVSFYQTTNCSVVFIRWLLFYRLHKENWRGIIIKCYQIKIDKRFVFVWLFNHLNNNNEIDKSAINQIIDC